MSERPEVFTDSAGAAHTEHDCRWTTSAVYPGFDVCLRNPVAHYRERAEAAAGTPVPSVREPLDSWAVSLLQRWREAGTAPYLADLHAETGHFLGEVTERGQVGTPVPSVEPEWNRIAAAVKAVARRNSKGRIYSGPQTMRAIESEYARLARTPSGDSDDG